MTPTIFAIFGITGDLATRKLLPALLSLYSQKKLHNNFLILGIARRPMQREEFRDFLRNEMNIKTGIYKEEEIKHFLDHIIYIQGNFTEIELYQKIAKNLADTDKRFKFCSNKLFHLSVPPELYDTILDKLSESGLTIPCSNSEGWTRVLIEKPFGNDSKTAKALDKKLGELFDESQIFRIDHYLAKESVQNILIFRFANSLFEPLWNKDFIERVHIKLLEKIDVQGRGNFYDKVGALKDVGQNHVLQMLSLIAMDEPDKINSTEIRKERARVLKNLQELNPDKDQDMIVRGQYEGYRDEKGVEKDSLTETYFRLETYIDNARWKNVPFYLESGKAMFESRTEIDVYFKSKRKEQNILTFKIQPDEGIKIKFWVKTPGLGLEIEPKPLKFKYSDFQSFGNIPDAYEKVINDAINGDQTLFASTDEVMFAWKFITPLLEKWKDIPLITYKKGSKTV